MKPNHLNIGKIGDPIGQNVILSISKQRQCIVLLSTNEKGVIRFKLKQRYFGIENYISVCACYTPIVYSRVYKNRNSLLFEFDFY